MKKEQFVDEVLKIYQNIRDDSYSSITDGSIISKESAMTLAIEAVKQDIEDKKRKEVFGSLFVPKERD